MKEFKNKETEVMIPDEIKSTQKELVTRPATYADLCLICIRTPKKEGFSVEEMRKRFRIIDALEGASKVATINLEDQDAAFLKEVMAEFKWSNMHKDIIELTDHVSDLKNSKK